MSQATELVSSTQTDLASTTTFGLPSELGDNREEAAKKALEILKDIERLGGSAGFEAWLKETDHSTKFSASLSLKTIDSEANSQAAGDRVYTVWVTTKSYFLYTKLEVGVVNDSGKNARGEGGCYGVGLGYSDGVHGKLEVYGGTSIEDLAQYNLKFTLRALAVLAGGFDIRFLDNGMEVAKIQTFGGGLVANIGIIQGDFKFTMS